MFKGGTSLSKVYRLIERFSEDIDLILDWRVLNGEDPLAERSRASQVRLNEAINQQAQAYIGGELLAHVTAALDEVCSCEIETDDLHVINVRYPAAFPDAYLRPEVRLEIGPLASWLPHEERTIQCYAAEAFPQVFERRECSVKVIKAERTFWEKATILHHEVHRPVGNPQPPRYSRHYYDVAKMAESPVKNAALTNLELLTDVVEFKERFYPRGWARYDLARPGSFRLVPEGHTQHVRLMEMDAAALTFADESFDIVYAPYFVNCVSDPLKVVREMHRVCKPGGKIVILNHFRSTNWCMSKFDRVLSPLTVHIGFKMDLDLPGFLAQTGLQPISIEKVSLPFWSLVICSRD